MHKYGIFFSVKSAFTTCGMDVQAACPQLREGRGTGGIKTPSVKY
jgi:hypothetical protein